MDVPDAEATGRWVGLDRGQNIPAAATPAGPVVFYKLKRIRHVRRVYAARRKKPQKAGKLRAVKKLARKERRLVTAINHVVSQDIVALAKRQDAGIRQTAKQRRAAQSDAGQNRDYWPFYQLERFIGYKAQLAGVAVERLIPAKPAPHAGRSIAGRNTPTVANAAVGRHTPTPMPR
jgi:putative transposase